MISSLKLAQFKKHEKFEIKVDAKIVLVYGNNAVGKTSILEAISLFSPGSGLFKKDLSDLVSFQKNAFEIFMQTPYKLHMLYIKEQNKKEFTINEAKKRPLELPEYLLVYGLTPYLAFAFWKDSTIKRKHIDRLVMQNDIRYASIYAKYSKAMKERNKLIETNQFNANWQNIYDSILIETGLEITKIRKKVLEAINNNLDEDIKQFLGSQLIINMSPTLEEQEQIFSKRLDTHFLGPHKTKFEIATKDFKGSIASTGQQKKLLLALTILALPKNDTPSILLLDDLFANLDEKTIKELIKILNKKHFQTWISNIDDINIDSKINVQKIHLSE